MRVLPPVILTGLWCASTLTAGEIIHVPADQTTIQAAIDVAHDGDVVLVADGVYTGAGNRNLDYGGKLITVRSAGGAEHCIIDCQSSGRAFFLTSGETTEAVIEGFTIRNGAVAWNDPGVGNGGAIYCEGSSPTITACIIRQNQCERDGAGIYCNWAAAPVISDCSIIDNLAGDYGGGICCYNDSNITLTDCTISGNMAIAGSGVASFACSPTVTGCAFINNTSSGSG